LVGRNSLPVAGPIMDRLRKAFLSHYAMSLS
jgi:hypothetical protein